MFNELPRDSINDESIRIAVSALSCASMSTTKADYPTMKAAAFGSEICKWFDSEA